MDITNFTFSEDDDSLQSQTLKTNIQLISRRLILNATPSPSAIAMNAHPFLSSNTSSPITSIIQGDHRATPMATFQWNSPVYFLPAPLPPYTTPSIFSYAIESDIDTTPVLPPPAQFRDEAKVDQEEPVDLSIERALDLRFRPESNTDDSPKPLALINLPEENLSSSFSDISADAHTKMPSPTAFTALDDTVYYPDPDSHSSMKKKFEAETITARDTTNCITNGRQPTVSNSENSSSLVVVTGLDTLKQSYDPSVDETGDKTSTTAIIDEAFQYLKDIADDTQTDNADTHSTKPVNSGKSGKMNQTYDVVPIPVLVKKPPTGLRHKRVSSTEKDSNSTGCGIEVKDDEKERELELKQQNCKYDEAVDDKSQNILTTDSSSFTSVTSLETDATKSTWSVKQAVTSLTSNLTLTLTKTYSTTALSLTGESRKSSGCNTQDLHDNLSSTPKSRVVIGSNNSIEESTIVKEASQISPSFRHSTVVSHAATPDVSLCTTQNPLHKGCNTYNAATDILSSTPREVRKPPIGGKVVSLSKSKEESLRTKLMKKSVPTKQSSTESDSVLNIAFRQDNKKVAPVKRKKRSLLKSLKRQFTCNNSDISQLSQHNQTVTATCFGGTAIKPQQPTRPRKKRSPKLFPKCSDVANTSSATISFVTLDRSSYSSPMPAWCKHILSTTETTSTPKPISTPTAGNTRKATNSLTQPAKTSQSTGVSTSSLPHIDNDSPAPCPPRPCLFDSLGSWLSQINSYHSPSKSVSVSTTAQDSPQVEEGSVQKQCCTKYEDKCTVTRNSSPPTKKSNAFSPKASTTSPQQSASPSCHPHSASQNQPKQTGQWVDFSPCLNSQIDLIGHVGRLTAEWLTTFVMDNTMKNFQSYFDEGPSRQVMLELCEMCNIRVKSSHTNSEILVLTKTRQSRVPTETDLKRLVRATRR